MGGRSAGISLPGSESSTSETIRPVMAWSVLPSQGGLVRITSGFAQRMASITALRCLGRILQTLVIKPEEAHLRIVIRGGGELFLLADGGDLFPALVQVGADVAAGGEGNIDLVPGLAIFEQGAGAGVLDIIRVRTACENVHVNSSFESGKTDY